MDTFATVQRAREAPSVRTVEAIQVQVRQIAEETFLLALALYPTRPFDWARDCPADIAKRQWPAIVGRGRGEVFRLQ